MPRPLVEPSLVPALRPALPALAAGVVAGRSVGGRDARGALVRRATHR